MIQQVANTDTFHIWLNATNQAIGVINLLTDGTLQINGTIVFANSTLTSSLTSVNVANTLTLTSSSGNSLFLLSSNAVVNGTIFSTGSGTGLIVANNATIGGNLTVSGNISVSNSIIANGTIQTQNINGNILVANTLTTNTITIIQSLQTANLTTTGTSNLVSEVIIDKPGTTGQIRLIDTANFNSAPGYNNATLLRNDGNTFSILTTGNVATQTLLTSNGSNSLTPFQINLNSGDVTLGSNTTVGGTITANIGTLPIGTMLPFTGPTAPPGFIFPYGQAISRTQYSKYFAVVGTNWGAGDGSTTFNVPDARGRTIFGADALGGTPANRITAASMSANTVGASGGNELLVTHNHGITDPQHNHGITDPGHIHGITDPQHTHSVYDIGHHHDVGVTTDLFSASAYSTVTSLVSGGTSAATSTSVTGVSLYAAATGISINSNVTSIIIDGNTTGITTQNNGGGNAQNVPPAIVINWILFVGV